MAKKQSKKRKTKRNKKFSIKVNPFIVVLTLTLFTTALFIKLWTYISQYATQILIISGLGLFAFWLFGDVSRKTIKNTIFKKFGL